MIKFLINIVIWSLAISFSVIWGYVAFKTLQHVLGACQ